MEYISFTDLVANAWKIKDTEYPATVIAYIRIAINIFVFLWSVFKLTTRKKQGPLFNYIYILCAAIFEITANIAFCFTSDYLQLYWFGHFGYNTMLWLSCITMFNSLILELKEIESASSACIVGRFYIHIAYIWTAIAYISGMFLKTVLIDESQLKLHEQKEIVDTFSQSLNLTLFAYFNKTGFIVLFMVLFIVFTKYLKLIPRAYNSFLAFGVLATIPILTDTLVLSYALRLKTLTVGDAITSLIMNFIFTDCFCSAALIIELIYSESWVFSIKEIKLFFDE